MSQEAVRLKFTVTVRDDVVAALDAEGMPLRADVRPVLTTKKGGIVTLGKAWMGKTVVVVELQHGKKR